MAIDIKTTLQSACRALLQPIALVALRCGMTWKEFSDLSKSVFVSVATDEFGLRGRPTNISRVSILTGISYRAEILISDTYGLYFPVKTIVPSTTAQFFHFLVALRHNFLQYGGQNERH